MEYKYNERTFFGFLVKGELNRAISYIKQFPSQIEQYHKYKSLFEDETYLTYDVDADLRQILVIYQQYYREVFYLNIEENQAAENMVRKFAVLFGLHNCPDLYEAAEQRITAAFTAKGFHILCGKTSGYYGPYIWEITESQTFHVELPNGIQQYTVKFLDRFISKSWLDYISFGKIGTGGWTDGDGIINCVRASYDTRSEAFQVSLLKHEAQHAMDLAKYKNISSADLEYRAKLVELIYSSERNLLEQFINEADTSRKSNGHTMASGRIAAEFLSKPNILSTEDIQAAARELFTKSTAEMDQKYL